MYTKLNVEYNIHIAYSFTSKLIICIQIYIYIYIHTHTHTHIYIINDLVIIGELEIIINN